MADDPLTSRPPADPIPTLIDNAVADLLGGGEARTITRHRAEPVIRRVAHEAERFGRRQALAELIPVGDVALMLGITRSRVWQAAREHDLGWRIGRDILFRPEDVAELRRRPPRGRPPKSGSEGG